MHKQIYLFVGVIAGTLFGAILNTSSYRDFPNLANIAVAAGNETYRQLNIFGDVFEKIRTDYIETPDDAKLVESAINGMLVNLDPHSSYFNPKAFKDLQDQTKSGNGGIGVEISEDGELFKIVNPIEGSPAFRAGLITDDNILSVDGEDLRGQTLNQVVDKLRGPLNSRVSLKIFRKLKSDTFTVTLVRDVIKISSVKPRNEGDIGYIKITQFTDKTLDGLKTAFDQFRRDIPPNKLKGYIIDLRNDPGGLLEQAIAVSDAFIETGEIVSIRGRRADDTQHYMAKSGDLANGKPLVVLINGGSASGSEIVAGALQDHKRATVIGTRSFGQGTIQSIIPLGANGALKLTTAMLYLPSGKSFQAKGIDPDIQVLPNVPDENKGKNETKGEAALKAHIKNGDGEQGGSSTYVPNDPKDDEQLNYALALLRGSRQ